MFKEIEKNKWSDTSYTVKKFKLLRCSSILLVFLRICSNCIVIKYQAEIKSFLASLRMFCLLQYEIYYRIALTFQKMASIVLSGFYMRSCPLLVNYIST